jgi:uncharacterized protein YjbJ (UPF0337 family)
MLVSDRARPNPHQAHRTKRDSSSARKPMGEIIDKVKGKIKKAVGRASGDKTLEAEGQMDEAKGKVKGAVEDVKHAVKDAMKK